MHKNIARLSFIAVVLMLVLSACAPPAIATTATPPPTTEIPRNEDGSFTLYKDEDGSTVTLTFAEEPVEGFKVVTKALPDGLPEGESYIWLFSFGVQDAYGSYLPEVTYELVGTERADERPWRIYLEGTAQEMNGKHSSSGDPPIGAGKP